MRGTPIRTIDRSDPILRPATQGGLRVARTSVFMRENHGDLRERWPLPGSRTPRDLARRVHDMQWIAESLCALHSMSVVVHGTIPRRPCVLIANHVGCLDSLAISSVVRCVAILDYEVASWPLLGEALVRLGNLFVRHGDPLSGAVALLRGRACLAQSVPVLVFSEVDASTGDEVPALPRGAFALARAGGVPVVPVSVQYRSHEATWVDDQTSLPLYLRTTAPTSTRVELVFGAPRPAGAPYEAS